MLTADDCWTWRKENADCNKKNIFSNYTEKSHFLSLSLSLSLSHAFHVLFREVFTSYSEHQNHKVGKWWEIKITKISLFLSVVNNFPSFTLFLFFSLSLYLPLSLTHSLTPSLSTLSLSISFPSSLSHTLTPSPFLHPFWLSFFSSLEK